MFGPRSNQTPLLMLLLAAGLALGACQAKEQSASLRFQASYAGKTIRCGQELEPGLQLTDLRLFVSALEVQTDEGRWQSTGPEPGVHLLDFEDGSAACTNGSPELLNSIKLSVPANTRGLRFQLGVPFEYNHADPLNASPPLNDPAMHWHWRSGYKFLRAGVAAAEKRWHVHLGSIACHGPVTAVSHCDRPNRVRVQLDDWQVGIPVEIQFDQLLAGIDIDAAKTTHCLSTEDNESCKQLGANLGLDFATGNQTGPGQVFTLGSER